MFFVGNEKINESEIITIEKNHQLKKNIVLIPIQKLK